VQRNYDEKGMHRTNFFGWAILGVVVIAILAIVIGFATHAFYPYPMTAMPYYYGGWWFFFPFGFIFFIFFIFLVSRLVFWSWGGWGFRRAYWYRNGYGDAREILRQRYARGEITKDQFDQMMRDLEQHN